VLGTASAIAVWAAIVWLRRQPWPKRRYVRLAAALMIAGITLLTVGYQIRHLAPYDTQRAINIRADLARIGLTMTAGAPVFGIGIGRFYPDSSRHLTPLLREYYAAENAHNNLVQIAAELGLAGLAGLLWLLWTALRRAVVDARALTTEEISAVAAIAGFGVTMMAGHPLLIPEVAFGFWIVVGSLAAHAVEPALSRRAGRAAVALALVAIGSVAFRAPARRAATDLEHVVIGFSPWQIGEDGERYRLVSGEAAFYAASDPAVATITEIAVRGDRTRALVTFSIEGRPGNQMEVGADGWRVIRLRMPPHAGGFRRITLTTDSPVRVGAIRARGRTDGS
jgi:hypothetical protein